MTIHSKFVDGTWFDPNGFPYSDQERAQNKEYRKLVDDIINEGVPEEPIPVTEERLTESILAKPVQFSKFVEPEEVESIVNDPDIENI